MHYKTMFTTSESCYWILEHVLIVPCSDLIKSSFSTVLFKFSVGVYGLQVFTRYPGYMELALEEDDGFLISLAINGSH